MMKQRYRKAKNGEVTLFSGVLKCADCGHSMIFTEQQYPPKETRTVKSYKSYACGTYRTHAIKRYTALEELDRSIVLELIDKIEVGQAYKVDKVKHQDVTIYYNFVGNISR